MTIYSHPPHTRFTIHKSPVKTKPQLHATSTNSTTHLLSSASMSTCSFGYCRCDAATNVRNLPEYKKNTANPLELVFFQLKIKFLSHFSANASKSPIKSPNRRPLRAALLAYVGPMPFFVVPIDLPPFSSSCSPSMAW